MKRSIRLGTRPDAGAVSHDAANGIAGNDARSKSGPMVALLPYQRAAVSAPARFTWNCWSRQLGKSFTFSLRRVIRGLMRGRNQIILSAGERQSREVMQKVRMHCHVLQAACEHAGHTALDGMSVSGLEARLTNNVRIIALPANPMTARGFSGDVFLDEFAMHRDDEAIWAALFPTLLRGDGELDIASTPRGQSNLFHTLRNNPEFACSTITLADAVSQGLRVDPGAMRRAIDDEQIWRQEFCCEFLDETTSFMPYALIRSCQNERLSTDLDEAAIDRPGADIYVGVDVGRLRDVTAIWVWRLDGEMYETLGVRVLRNAPFAAQEAAVSFLLDKKNVRRCCIDSTGMGMHLAERLVQRYGDHRVEGLTFTPALKCQLAGQVRVMAERELLRIPADPDVSNDWHSIARSASSTGHVRFDANRSSGGHGDRFWAAALGLHAARDAMPSCDISTLMTSGPTRFGRQGAW